MAEPPQADPKSAPLAAKSVALAGDLPVEHVEPFESARFEEIAHVSQAPGQRFSQEKHRAKATKLLALLLFAALIVFFAAHFVTIWYFIHDKPALDEFNRAFNIWIPVLSGLFGSAATFYFTQGRK
jgi:sterol desaturase/sphingolipid hydroxylase (fatty acid hydroxylase superfamily)